MSICYILIIDKQSDEVIKELINTPTEGTMEDFNALKAKSDELQKKTIEKGMKMVYTDLIYYVVYYTITLSNMFYLIAVEKKFQSHYPLTYIFELIEELDRQSLRNEFDREKNQLGPTGEQNFQVILDKYPPLAITTNRETDVALAQSSDRKMEEAPVSLEVENVDSHYKEHPFQQEYDKMVRNSRIIKTVILVIGCATWFYFIFEILDFDFSEFKKKKKSYTSNI